jgi:catechol 2,3-dioxygenase-like lactoylglutathione lyase family enzyme
VFFTHIVIGSNDLERSRRFYDAIFAAMDLPAGVIDPKGRLVYAKDGQRLLLTTPINGLPATFANGGTIGILLPSNEAVDVWHSAGLTNGGQSAEDPPGFRTVAGRQIYLAYLRDPDGNKLCASHRPS